MRVCVCVCAWMECVRACVVCTCVCSVESVGVVCVVTLRREGQRWQCVHGLCVCIKEGGAGDVQL